MNAGEARLLTRGCPVLWISTNSYGPNRGPVKGVVTQAAPYCICIDWDDGGKSACHPEDMRQVTLAVEWPAR